MPEHKPIPATGFLMTVEPAYMLWSPQPDITVFELAKLMPVLVSRGPIAECMLPPDANLRRHFKPVEGYPCQS